MIITEEEARRLDNIGGHPGERWHAGSCWGNEGQYLYRTVREMEPDVVVEVGRWQGCSTSHLALGCMHNGKGKVYSIDIDSRPHRIDEYLLPWIEFITADALTFDWKKEKGVSIDVLLEDGSHAPGFTETVLRNFPARRVIIHDWNHPNVPNPKPEAIRLFGEPDFVFFEPPTDCGYGVYDFDKRKA